MTSHFHVNRKRKEMILLETSMYKHVMRAVCVGAPQPRNGRTWQAANVSGLMHDGETEGLKQRCVHQKVSDSSG